MERDPRVDPQFGDELLCQKGAPETWEPAVVRVVARGRDGDVPTVEVLTRREAGIFWRHMSLALKVYKDLARGATVTRTGGEG